MGIPFLISEYFKSSKYSLKHKFKVFNSVFFCEFMLLGIIFPGCNQEVIMYQKWDVFLIHSNVFSYPKVAVFGALHCPLGTNFDSSIIPTGIGMV